MNYYRTLGAAAIGFFVSATAAFAGCPNGLKDWPSTYRLVGGAPVRVCATAQPALAPVTFQGRSFLAMVLKNPDFKSSCEKSDGRKCDEEMFPPYFINNEGGVIEQDVTPIFLQKD